MSIFLVWVNLLIVSLFLSRIIRSLKYLHIDISILISFKNWHQLCRMRKTMPSVSNRLNKPFRVPFKDTTNLNNPNFSSSKKPCLGVRKRLVPKKPKAKYDPFDQDAIILYSPEDFENYQSCKENYQQSLYDFSIATKNQKPHQIQNIPVVVDPLLRKVLRPHQIEGVKFMYNALTGRIVEKATGCIMADEMGLGKTLQCITLLWTLLEQSPTVGQTHINKAIIVAPSSLVTNWSNEIVKWLGNGRVRTLVIDNKLEKNKQQELLQTFSNGSLFTSFQAYQVLIISYDTLRTNVAIFENKRIGLMLCDEGHKLKNSSSLTYQALNEMKTDLRVVLSGTPVQNDLAEFFSLFTFANPGLLGNPSEFRKYYEIPILRGRDSDASDSERKLGEDRLNELSLIASKLIIRRTNKLLSQYLPTKYEYVVFCRITSLQEIIYQQFRTKSASLGEMQTSLQLITSLRQLCNHPSLMNVTVPLTKSSSTAKDLYLQSGKMSLLIQMLSDIKKTTTDRVILISNFTQTLDLLQTLCNTYNFRCIRLDGKLTISKRQQLVDQFNRPGSQEFIFLLSSKAGGCGLNLVSANRLILFDPDWNPANDSQALARIWRDGQKKDCFIYRFIATGTIEEKIFQRQCHKQSLSSCVVDYEENVERHFSREYLQKLFELNLDSECETHDKFRCRRCIQGVQFKRSAAMTEGLTGFSTNGGKEVSNDPANWDHFNAKSYLGIHDTVLKSCFKSARVSFAFQFTSHVHNK